MEALKPSTATSGAEVPAGAAAKTVEQGIVGSYGQGCHARHIAQRRPPGYLTVTLLDRSPANRPGYTLLLNYRGQFPAPAGRYLFGIVEPGNKQPRR